MALDSAIGVISRWRSACDNNSYIFSGRRDEIDQYLQAIDVIQCSIASGTSDDQIRAESAIQTAMLTLADEMHNLLKINGQSTDNPDSSTYSSTITDSGSNSYVDEYEYGSALSAAVIDDLRCIAKRMNGAGYLRECKEAYISNRKRCVGASYQRLNIQKLSSKDAHTMEWNTLESVIKVWIQSAKICFRKIFSYEKQLCEKIFGDLGDGVDDDCFQEISNNYASQLLEIAANLSSIKTASDRLFGILDLYKTFSDLLQEMNKLFNTQSSESFRTDADQMVTKLAGAACMTVEKFEKDLLTADMSHILVDKIHSLCKYVMEYVVKLGQNKQTLMKLSLCKPPLASGAEMNFTNVEPQLQNKLPFHVMWIIMCLVSKLEGEARLYMNASDIPFYLMNNLFYIVKKIDGKPELKEMIGDDSFKNVSSKFDKAKTEYLKLTSAKVLSILGGNTSLQKRLNDFNDEFEKLKDKLKQLNVLDFQLLMDIRVSMEKMLIPAYSLFLRQLSTSSCSTSAVKFSVEELKTAILGFFSKPETHSIS